MKNWSKKQWIIAYAFVAITGTIFHFMYDWLQQIKIAGYFFPVNESTWEHMKLVYFPMILCTMIFLKNTTAQWWLGNLVGTWLIPVIFYSYKGILGFEISVLDIVTFFVSVAGGFLIIKHTLNSQWNDRVNLILKILVILQGVLFGLFTYNPPNLGIFVNP